MVIMAKNTKARATLCTPEHEIIQGLSNPKQVQADQLRRRSGAAGLHRDSDKKGSRGSRRKSAVEADRTAG
ncbi:hypothetical protein A2791_03355 [Candidatus Saccharibacteria bacterium RIFCSPHIGHO2_01_FULL_46_30]|nr:MAG: hypothetical protein A2791_03355 [Candidatus Saccharibacteria bacterium RIFCSPHIGHO2_01_FULL_46_30]